MKKLIACLLLFALCLSALAGCSNAKDDGNDALTAAKDYLYNMYKNADEATPSDYKRPAVVAIDGKSYNVTWTADVKTGSADDVKIVTDDSKMVTIDVNEQASTKVEYVLTASVSDGSKTASTSFNHYVPEYKEFSWADFVAAKEGDTVVVKGVVTGIIAKSKGNSSNCLYLQDNEGGYYVYNLSSDPVTDLKISVGNTVSVTGARSTYSGTYEIVNASVEIVDSGVTSVNAYDLTSVYAGASSLKDAALAEKQALLVTVKGVTVTDEDAGSGYYRFKLGSLESYVRISGSVCPLTKDDQATFKAAHAEHFGWLADVTGVLCVYDGAFYLTPVTVDAFNYISLPELSDAEKVASEKDILKLPASVTENTSIDLPSAGTNYEDVAISWTSDNDCAVVSDGKLVITLPEADTAVTVTATLTLNGVTETKEFVIKLSTPKSALSVDAILEIMKDYADKQISEGQYTVFGEVISSSFNSKYSSYTIELKTTAGEVPFKLYSVGIDPSLDKEAYHEDNGLVGFIVTCTGFLQLYGTTPEMPYLSASASPTGAAFTPTISNCVKPATVAEMIDFMKDYTSGQISTEQYTICGVVTSSKYKANYNSYDIWLTDGENGQAFQLYSAVIDESIAGDFSADDALAGYTVYCTGYLQLYNTTYEIGYLSASKSPTGEATSPVIFLVVAP